jgi:hypothetical protein
MACILCGIVDRAYIDRQMTTVRPKRLRLAIGAAVLAVGVTFAWKTIAANHSDGPTVRSDPSTEITDLYAWMSADKAKVNLVMNVFPNVPAGSKFSTLALYVFHLSSAPAYGQAATETKIICGFDAVQAITCWVGDREVVSGDASAPAGLTSASGKTRVFAGPRDDPSFFNQSGFLSTAATIKSAQPSMDAAGCLTVNAAQSQLLVSMLKQDGNGGPAKNDFAGQNVLSIVVQVDTALVTPGGKILGVWASTHKKG